MGSPICLKRPFQPRVRCRFSIALDPASAARIAGSPARTCRRRPAEAARDAPQGSSPLDRRPPSLQPERARGFSPPSPVPCAVRRPHLSSSRPSPPDSPESPPNPTAPRSSSARDRPPPNTRAQAGTFRPSELISFLGVAGRELWFGCRSAVERVGLKIPARPVLARRRQDTARSPSPIAPDAGSLFPGFACRLARCHYPPEPYFTAGSL
jgi:hypothetical protein